MTDYISREAARTSIMSKYDEVLSVADALECIDSLPAADVVPMDFHERCLQIEIQKRMALEKADVRPVPMWTDEPISGTEFMTHNQGQSGFEIHFLTDDKAKYEAVQDECRRQIGHAKPAADVRPVVLCKDCKRYGGRPWENNETGTCGRTDFGVSKDDFCSYGEKREES